MNGPVWHRDYSLWRNVTHPAILRFLRVRYKVIEGCEDPVPMLVRYRLFDTPWGSLNIHHFLRSDHDRALHDHPFHFASLVLAGGYREHLPVRAAVAKAISTSTTLVSPRTFYLKRFRVTS